jgi:hypothetical protein
MNAYEKLADTFIPDRRMAHGTHSRTARVKIPLAIFNRPQITVHGKWYVHITGLDRWPWAAKK